MSTSRTATSKSQSKKMAGKGQTTSKAQKPIDLYYWPTPNGWKISIFCEEAKLPYNLVPVNIGAGDQFKRSFLNISPNNRMPAIVDPAGPGGKPISVFESGAILQYLGNKTGKFYPKATRARVAVDQWLFWQMGGLGPMAGQAHHFRQYSKDKIPYAIDRYTDEVNRLYGVLNKQLRTNDFVAGKYSIADMAIWPWIVPWKNQGQDLDDFKHLKKWFERIRERPAVQRGFQAGLDWRQKADLRTNEKARATLFGQRARK